MVTTGLGEIRGVLGQRSNNRAPARLTSGPEGSLGSFPPVRSKLFPYPHALSRVAYRAAQEEMRSLTFEEREVEEPDLEDEDDVEDPEEVEAELAASTEEDDSDETSLDELLAQRAARRAPDESDDDVEDIMTLASEREPTMREPLPSRVIPIRDRQEFVCSNCHLVKKRSQLADADRALCRDCV